MQRTSSKNSFMKFELTVYVHKFNCDGDVLVVISSNVTGLFRGDDGMIDNAFSECLLGMNDSGWLLSSIFNVFFCMYNNSPITTCYDHNRS